jgi:hypothetical protein
MLGFFLRKRIFIAARVPDVRSWVAHGSKSRTLRSKGLIQVILCDGSDEHGYATFIVSANPRGGGNVVVTTARKCGSRFKQIYSGKLRSDFVQIYALL